MLYYNFHLVLICSYLILCLFIGIDHFFIYSTGITETDQKLLRQQLSDYVAEGLVTFVLWNYNNCAKTDNFASGRYASFFDPADKKVQYMTF